MANYRISSDAKGDLQRIYRRGVIEFGEAQGGSVFRHLVRDSTNWRSGRTCIRRLMTYVSDTGEAFVVSTAFITESSKEPWRS